MKKFIVQFYSKAKAYEQLITFFIGWANLETGEGEYDNALKVLKEASKYGMKLHDYNDTEINGRMKEIEMFIQAQHCASSDTSKSRLICTELVDGKRWGSVHPGDCYALLVQLAQDSESAYEVIEKMVQQDIDPTDYIEAGSVVNIYSSVGKVWGESEDVQE